MSAIIVGLMVLAVLAFSHWCAWDSGYDKGWGDHFDSVRAPRLPAEQETS